MSVVTDHDGGGGWLLTKVLCPPLLVTPPHAVYPLPSHISKLCSNEYLLIHLSCTLLPLSIELGPVLPKLDNKKLSLILCLPYLSSLFLNQNS